MATREEVMQRHLERESREGASFASRQKAQAQLHALGLAHDPWGEPELSDALDAVARSTTVAAALADAGRTLLANEHLEPLDGWMQRLIPATPEDAEAMRIVRALLLMRAGEHEEAISLVDRIPHSEAVALHGLALLQLRRPNEAASRLEVLLAADALDGRGELAATYLPSATPVLSLFLHACCAVTDDALRRGEGERARLHAGAIRDALRRYPEGDLSDGPEAEDLRDLLHRAAQALPAQG